MPKSTPTASGTRKIRYHHKQRTGCASCKGRRVKCDERKPRCSQCERSSDDCVYANVSRWHSDDQQSRNADSEGSLDSEGSVVNDRQQSLSISNHVAVDGFNLVHMELLYHWCTTTSLTMTRSPDLATLWRTIVTELGLKNDFLLWAMLACSARHLSRLQTNKQIYYEDLATDLQDKALRSLNAVQALSQVGEVNCGPIFIFSTLMFLNTMATRRKPSDDLNIRSAIDWIVFLQGTTSVAIFAKPWLPSGNVAPLLQFGRLGPSLQENRRQEGFDTRSKAHDPLEHLKTLFVQVHETEKRLLYTKLLGKLQNSFSAYQSLPKESDCTSVVFQWPAQLSEEYFKHLMNHDQEAMVLFAYYTVLMSKALPCWWLEGRPERIMASIYTQLGENYRIWIRWPMEQLAWAPE